MFAWYQDFERLRPTKTWLVTGVAGFIGSHLLETLLRLDQTVVGIDNFATGHQHNLDQVRALVGPERFDHFRFIEADIRDPDACRVATRGVDYVLHQAALGSVPRSIEDPIAANATNIDGFLNMLVAARDAGVTRFVYAASSSTYGDEGTYKCYKSVECIMPGVHDYTKFLKRGYGRATDHASQDCRTGLMTREEANEYIRAHDPKRPAILEYYLKSTGYTEEEFYRIMDRQREATGVISREEIEAALADHQARFGG